MVLPTYYSRVGLSMRELEDLLELVKRYCAAKKLKYALVDPASSAR